MILQNCANKTSLGDLSPGPKEGFVGAVLENHTDKPIYTSSPRKVFLQHKVDGEWIETPHLTFAGHTGTEQHIKIESGASKKVGVDKRLYPLRVHEPYRLKVVLIDPDTGKPSGSLVSRPSTLKTSDQSRADQSATAPESRPDDEPKPESESESRSR